MLSTKHRTAKTVRREIRSAHGDVGSTRHRTEFGVYYGNGEQQIRSGSIPFNYWGRQEIPRCLQEGTHLLPRRYGGRCVLHPGRHGQNHGSVTIWKGSDDRNI
jgi:hypothetical protein